MAEPADEPPTEREDSRTDVDTIVRGLFHRLHLENLEARHDSRVVQAAFTFVNGTVSIALLAVVAHFARAPFVFPSLGPTAFLLFHRPLTRSSSPKSTITGHLIGACAGWASLMLFGLVDAPSALEAGVTWSRAAAAGLSLGVTGGLMVFFRVPHPPAGATTLIVSLGLMPHLWQLPILMVAVVLLTAQGWAINRLAGLDYPIWSNG